MQFGWTVSNDTYRPNDSVLILILGDRTFKIVPITSSLNDLALRANLVFRKLFCLWLLLSTADGLLEPLCGDWWFISSSEKIEKNMH